MAEFPTYEQMAKNVAEKALDEILYDGKSIREWMKIIVEQEPKTEWIPVSERLPEKHGIYFVTKENRKVDVCCTNFYHEGSYDFWVSSEQVIAWQSLPEPYKGE